MGAKKALLSALLGLVQGGSKTYSDIKDQQQKFALERLKLAEPPADIKSLEYVVPGFRSLTPDKKTSLLFNYRAAQSPYGYSLPKLDDNDYAPPKKTAVPRVDTSPPSVNRELLEAHEERIRSLHPGLSEAEVTIRAGQALKQDNKDDELELLQRMGLPQPKP